MAIIRPPYFYPEIVTARDANTIMEDPQGWLDHVSKIGSELDPDGEMLFDIEIPDEFYGSLFDLPNEMPTVED